MPMFDDVGEDMSTVGQGPMLPGGLFGGGGAAPANGAPHTGGFGGMQISNAVTQRAGGALGVAAQAIVPWMKPGVPSGVSTPDEEMDFLPFDEELNDGVFDASHTDLSFISFPQRPFRGERMVITAFSATVSDPASNVVVTPAIYVGATQVGATQGRTPIAMFSPTAFGVRLSLPRAGQGTRIQVPLSTLVTLAGSDEIACSVSCVGRAVR